MPSDPHRPANLPDPTRTRWLHAVRRNLRRWYARHRRAMPWRADPGHAADPYHVLVSETMLQQTQVATVIPYFQRFIAAWPTLRDLAAADQQDVLTGWQGLGYYRRARNLHRCARAIVDHHAGNVPESLEALHELPGIGRYTAGAIRSIAFQKPAPILDGNVARVLARLTGLTTSIDQPAARRTLWAEADRLVARTRQPGDLNQAVMELGATVCLPRGPRCLTCPLRNQCLAFATGRTEDLPVRDQRRPPRPVTHEVLIIERDGRLAFEQRPGEGLWADLWQLPTLEHDREIDPDAAALIRHARQQGLALADTAHLGGFTHITTHRRIRFQLWRATLDTPAGDRPTRWTWRDPASVDLPLSNAQRRALGHR